MEIKLARKFRFNLTSIICTILVFNIRKEIKMETTIPIGREVIKIQDNFKIKTIM